MLRCALGIIVNISYSNQSLNNKEIYIKLEKAVGDNNVQEVSNILDQHSDLDLNDENLYTLHPPLCRAAKKGF